MLTRRRFLQSTAALLAVPAVAHSEASRTLRYVPQTDLSTLDPIWTTNYDTRDNGFLVFDTLFGLDGQLQPHPQMAQGAVTEDEGKTWRITLRDGLQFHDGERVLTRDCVASIRRWGARDAFGQALLAATDEIAAPDDKTILFRLKRPFPLLPNALGKMAPHMCAIMPERFAKTDPYKQVSEMIGSGPYRFKPDERVPGSQIVYERNNKYVPRPEGSADGSAGPKIAHFDRIEWRIMPDAGTVSAALQQGEIDWWQRPLPDLLPMLSRHPRLKAAIINTAGNIATMRFNHLNPPFNNAAIRRAMLGAVDQREYATAAFGTDNIRWRDGVGYFPPGTPMASGAGMEALTAKRDLSRVRRDIEAAGYKGEKIVVLWPTSDPILKAYADVSIDTLKKLDLIVDAQAMDWATVMMRRTKTEPVERGGWSLFDTGWNGLDMVTPVGNVFLRGNGRAATVGWPDSPKIEALCDEWLRAPDLAAQKTIAEKLQLQAFEDVPYIPLCQYLLPAIHQANLTGFMKGITAFWNVQRM